VVAEHRPAHRSLQQLVRDFEHQVEPQQPAAGNPPAARANVPAAGPPPLPIELTTSLALLEEKPQELAVDFRPKLRAKSYRPFDLPGQFHLSISEGRRLLAILALEAEPDLLYLRWLSERVIVEKPFAGFTAAQALTAAALRFPAEQVARLRPAVDHAAEALDGLVESDNENTGGFDIAARSRQLQLAASMLDMRSRKWSVLTPQDINEFLAALSLFDSAGLDQLCRNQLQTPLKWLANPSEPIELIIVNIVLTARDKGWLPDLVRAAYTERKDDATFTRVYKLFGPPLGAGV
jgi:hypothetical protein